MHEQQCNPAKLHTTGRKERKERKGRKERKKRKRKKRAG